MPDIFDQVAPDTAAPAAGDIFDRIAAPKLSDSLTQPDQAEQHATMAARQAVNAATLPRPGIGDLFNAGRAVLGAGLDTFRSGMQTPLVDVNRMIPASVGPGVARGAADVASGLTTPSNLMMLAGFPEGVAGKLLGLGFSAQQLVDAAHEVPGFTDAVRAKDYGRARQIATHAVLSTLLAAMAAKHGRAAEPAAPEATPTMVRDARGGDIFDRVAKEQPNVPQSPPGHGAAAAEEKRQSASAAGPVPVAGPQPAGEPGPAAEPSRAPAAAAPSAPVTELEPAGAPTTTVPDGKPHEYFRGDWNIPLNETGRQQVAAAAGRNPGQFDEIYSGTKDRHQETAAEFLRANPQAGQVKTDPAFDPMHLGMHEGEEVTPERLADVNDRLRNRPDEPIPGVGKFSGSPGERPRDWANRLIGKLQQIAADWKPGERKLIVTSGRDVQAVRAWAARGMPADRSVDPGILTSRWQTEPGQMLRLDPRTGKLEDVDHATEDGIYFARHGETDGNANPAIPEDVRNQSGSSENNRNTGRLGQLSQNLEGQAQAANERLRQRGTFSGTKLNAGLPADDLADLAVWGAAKLAKGIVDFARWSGEMVSDFGERVRPHLEEIYRAAYRHFGTAPEVGPRGPVFRQFYHDARGAIEHLLKQQDGEAIGALEHHAIGDIDLVWGRPGTAAKKFKDGFGVAHILAKHEEMRPQIRDLGEIVARLPVAAVERDGQEIRLEDDRYRAIVSKVWQPKGEVAVPKSWLLTTFEPKEGKGKTPSPTDSLDAGRSSLKQGSGTATPPGGASTSTIAPEIAGVNRTTGPADPFGARTLHGGIPLDVVGAIFRADLKEMREMKARRDAALAALEQSKETPEDKAFGQKVISYFTGERDLWAARVNQVMARLRKLVPDTVEQEALSLMRDFKGREQELTQFLQGTHPALHELDQDQPLLRGGPGSAYAKAMEQIEKLRPVILKALNPTARMLEADAALTKIAAGTLREGQRLEFLDSRWTPEQYNPHILNRKGEGELPEPNRDRWGKSLGGKIGKYFGFAERREFPSLLDAIAQGYRPKTLNAFDAFTIHGDRFATARATRLLENQLRDTGIGVYAAQGKAPRGWVRLAPHSNEFRKLVPFLREGQAVGSTDAARQVAERKLAGMRQGKSYEDVSREESERIAEEDGGNAAVPDVAELGLWVPEYIEKALRPITDPDYLGRIPAFKFTRHAQAYQKAVQLGLSLFHATSENYMALANMGPRGWLKALRADRLDPEFEKAERDFIAHGGTSSIQGRTVEAYKSLGPGTIPSWGEIWRKAPVIHQADQLAGQITEFTFGKLQRQFKVTDYQLHAAAWLAEHPNATPAEVNAAKASIAKEINAVYGGLNTELLGVNRATTEMARALLLAPDWTFSNIFNVRYSLERGTEAGKLARLFWIRQMAGGMIATQLLSLALAHKPSTNPTQVYFGKDKDGQDVYQNVFFKGAAGDVINLAHNVWDYGAVSGLARTMSAKSAGFARAGMQLMTNRDYLGHTIVSPELNPIAGTVRGAWKVGESLAPVPFSVTNLKDMLVGPHADEYTVPEFLTTPFSGNPPRHIPPPGFRMGPEGIEEKDEEERQRNSLWRQIVTGQAYAGRNQ